MRWGWGGVSEAVGCGEGLSPLVSTGGGSRRRKNQFWISNRRILVQTGCFLYNSPKAAGNAVPTVKITLGTIRGINKRVNFTIATLTYKVLSKHTAGLLVRY